MTKKLLLLAVLALALPMAAFASSGGIDFTNSGGMLQGSDEGLSLSGSTVIAVDGLGGGLITGNDLGRLSFSTGALISGSLAKGGVFAGGGSFTITGNGQDGLPNGVIFSGTFTGPVTWTMTTLANGTHNYTLTGTISGTFNGVNSEGTTVQLTVNTGKGYFNCRERISSGDTNVVVPEPGSLSLLGTGLIGVAGMIRRKLKA